VAYSNLVKGLTKLKKSYKLTPFFKKLKKEGSGKKLKNTEKSRIDRK